MEQKLADVAIQISIEVLENKEHFPQEVVDASRDFLTKWRNEAQAFVDRMDLVLC